MSAGAKLVPFAGWEMPVQYEGIRQEHIAVRRSAGLFDVSHMGEVETSGPDAEAFLQHLLSNDVTKIAEHGAQYSVLCREDGGVLDDLFTYRLEDRFLTVTNAANHAKDYAWLARHAEGFDVRVGDAAADYAMLALQGPDARSILARHLEGEAPARMRSTRARVAGADCLVAGTGYTGEDGVELLLRPGDAPAVWDAEQERPAPVVRRDRDVVQLEPLHQLAEQVRDAAHREVGVRPHRPAVGAERQRGEDAAVLAPQLGDHAAPERAGHHQAVAEDDRRAVASGVLVLDGARRQLQLWHRGSPPDF